MQDHRTFTSFYKQVRIGSLFAGSMPKFSLYIRYGSRYTLYKAAGTIFSRDDIKKILDNGITQLYVCLAEIPAFNAYVEQNVTDILNNPNIPVEEKGSLLLNASGTYLEEVFSSPQALSGQLERCYQMVERIVSFIFQDPKCLEQLTTIVNHHYNTYSHLVHVTALSVALTYSNYPGIFYDELVDIGMGSVLHDFGKIFIPKSILDKPGKLTPDEWIVVKEHPKKGCDFLKQHTSLSKNVLDVVLSHHEKYDGSGYPFGLKGPGVGRNSLAVATSDVYCALTTDRSYRAALPSEKALEIMEGEMAGSFAPEMIQTLKRIVLPPKTMILPEEGLLAPPLRRYA